MLYKLLGKWSLSCPAGRELTDYTIRGCWWIFGYITDVTDALDPECRLSIRRQRISDIYIMWSTVLWQTNKQTNIRFNWKQQTWSLWTWWKPASTGAAGTHQSVRELRGKHLKSDHIWTTLCARLSLHIQTTQICLLGLIITYSKAGGLK